MNEVSPDFHESAAAAELARRIAAGQGQLRLVPDLTLGLLHKLNNVMTSLYFTAEGCESEIEIGHPAREMMSDLTQAVRDAQQLISLTADVNLSLGSTEEEYHDLNALVQQNLFLVKIALPKSALVEVNTNFEPAIVRISVADFRRVLFSVAANARDAASERPRVSLRIFEAKQESVDEYFPALPEASNKMIALAFTDNGLGMTPSIIERAFEPFFTTRDDRLGLGLFHAQQIARKNGGYLSIRRNVSNGAEVVWFMPRVTE